MTTNYHDNYSPIQLPHAHNQTSKLQLIFSMYVVWGVPLTTKSTHFEDIHVGFCGTVYKQLQYLHSSNHDLFQHALPHIVLLLACETVEQHDLL